MKIEHFAINVAKPVEMADWYVKNLGLTIVAGQKTAPYAHFLADNSGKVMLEIYCNPADQVPAYGSMDPLILHLAFVSENPSEDKDRLMRAGATLESETISENGNHLVMLRDPWGLALQLCKRAKSLLAD
ncbi:MAG: VOC family protein [Porphyromonadaceae bacterium]|jgi:catechol-2,3-dioxygenase|nr:VOC family protein [Porphyromonadaceae bacterium]